MVLDALVEILDEFDRSEPDAGTDPDLPLEDVSEEPESVDSGASVMVPLADSKAVEAGSDVADGFGDRVCDGPSLDEPSCLLMIKPSMFFDEPGHGHAAAKLKKKRRERSRKRPEPFILKAARCE